MSDDLFKDALARGRALPPWKVGVHAAITSLMEQGAEGRVGAQDAINAVWQALDPIETATQLAVKQAQVHLDEQTLAANHWFTEANRDHNELRRFYGLFSDYEAPCTSFAQAESIWNDMKARHEQIVTRLQDEKRAAAQTFSNVVEHLAEQVAAEEAEVARLEGVLIEIRKAAQQASGEGNHRLLVIIRGLIDDVLPPEEITEARDNHG